MQPGQVGPTDGQSQILFISDERGWPRTSGYRRRTAQLLRSVAELGPTVWVVAPRNHYDDGESVELPADLADRVTVVAVSAPDRRRWQTAMRWLRTGLPWPLAAGDWGAADRALSALADHRFDLVWAMGIDALLASGRAGVEARCTIVDADLESLKLRRRLDDASKENVLKRLIMRVDHGRWCRLEQAAAASTTGFSVCSEDERRRLGPPAFVTPNSYTAPSDDGVGEVVTIDQQRSRNRFLFVGSLVYQPNTDGLRWFADDVWPIIRQAAPDVGLRVVGSGGGDLPWLRSIPGVELVGSVDDIGHELAVADLTVVPVRWGAGTRIKILESFAYRVPVVSTSLGAEGLKVESGRELLLADEPEAFARACLQIHRDGELAGRLVEAGHDRFMTDYEESAVRHGLSTRLRGLLADAAPINES